MSIITAPHEAALIIRPGPAPCIHDPLSKRLAVDLSALVVAMGLAFGVLLSNAYSTIDSVLSDSAHNAATTSQLRAAEARISALTTEVSWPGRTRRGWSWSRTATC